MKWTKLGKLFDPTEHALPNRCTQYAQSPQALVRDWGVRFYFSTRERDASGKYLSHIAYADYAPDLKTLLGVCGGTVIPLGGLGSFDEHGIFPVHILEHGGKLLAYTTGWSRRAAVSAESAIGYAWSEDDGRTFTKLGEGPVLTASLHEPFLVADPFIVSEAGLLHMFYIYGLRWKQHPDEPEPDRVYKIARATSTDGVRWKRASRPIIPDALDEDECQALPTLFRHGGRWHMYFCFREYAGFRTQPGKGYRLGYAHSADLEHWVRDDAAAGISLSDSGWDSSMMCYPTVFRHQGRIYMAYNGNEFGRLGFGLAVLEEDGRP